MTSKADFNAEEWGSILQAPALAAMRVIAADRGGTIRESVSLAREYAEARREGGGGILKDVVSSPPQLDPTQFRTPDDVRELGGRRLREALDALERKATPEEVEAYRRFVLDVADTVARAHREGGFLGVGGKDVSPRERAVLDEIAAAVGRPAA